ncbi:BRISC complex subunit abraxas 2-like [Oscarella lobularis]|uniref:BRISC complex subunit abraxas 2-like n=1 Tax=Oscarella lobularis TaxID=121494 RepID=UPI003313BF93
MEVSLPGFLLSTFFLDANGRDQCDAEGFFLGRLDCGKNQKTAVIDEIVCCERLFSFYNRLGEVQIDDVYRLTKGKFDSIIGWFRLRRNTVLRVSLRERAVHQSLLNYLTHLNRADVLFGAFTGSSSPNDDTKSFDYSIWTLNGAAQGQFLARKVTIINLGHTAKDAYECSLLKVTSDTLTRVLSEFKSEDSVSQITRVYETILGKLESLGKSVNESQDEIDRLQEDIKNLHEAIELKNTSSRDEREKETQAH